MKLAAITEAHNGQAEMYRRWVQAVRAAWPNATFTGSKYQAQAVDWMSRANEVAGDWENDKGVVYKPGSMGREVLEVIGER